MAEGGRSSGPSTRDSSMLDSSAPASPIPFSTSSEGRHAVRASPQVHANPPKGKHSARGEGANEPKTVSESHWNNTG